MKNHIERSLRMTYAIEVDIVYVFIFSSKNITNLKFTVLSIFEFMFCVHLLDFVLFCHERELV